MTARICRHGALVALLAFGCAHPDEANNVADTVQLVAEPANGVPPDPIDGKGRPAYRAGSPRPWEGGAVSGAPGWSVHPGGSVQNRVRLVAWPSPAVGEPITVSLV